MNMSRLLSQAHVLAAKIDEQDNPRGMPRHTNLNFVFEKFGELVVRECLKFVEPMHNSGDIDDLALKLSRNQIMQHFGVNDENS